MNADGPAGRSGSWSPTCWSRVARSRRSSSARTCSRRSHGCATSRTSPSTSSRRSRRPTGWTRDPAFWVDYELRSLPHSIVHGVKVGLRRGRCTRADASRRMFPTADWHERETFDFYGIVFDGHPDLTRILLPDDWRGIRCGRTSRSAAFPRGSTARRCRRSMSEDGLMGETSDDDSARPAGRRGARVVPRPATGEVRQETMIINMGPQHPSTHGVLRLRPRARRRDRDPLQAGRSATCTPASRRTRSTAPGRRA